MFIKLVKWLVCLFVIPLLPFLIDWALLFVSDPTAHSAMKLPPFWERGEFLILAIAMAATGFSDLSTSQPPQLEASAPNSGRLMLVRALRFIVLTSSVVIFSGSLLIYVAVSACVVHGKPYSTAFVTQWSPVIFIFSAVVGLASVVLSKET